MHHMSLLVACEIILMDFIWRFNPDLQTTKFDSYQIFYLYGMQEIEWVGRFLKGAYLTELTISHCIKEEMLVLHSWCN